MSAKVIALIVNSLNYLFLFFPFVDRLVVIENGWLFCILGNIWNNKERICSSIIIFSLEFVYNPIKMISMVPDI